MRRPMFGEPLIAHPAEIGGAHATWHPHPGDDDDRDQRDDDADDEQHLALAAFRSAHNDSDTRDGDCLSACAQAFDTWSVTVILCDVQGARIRQPAVLACQVQTFRGLRVHSGTARFNAGAYA